MNTIHTAGWFDDPTCRNLRRFWDGTRWTDHVQRHDGSSALEPVASVAPEAPRTERAPAALPTTQPVVGVVVPGAAALRNSSRTAKILFGGVVVATAATFLPWEQDRGPFGEPVTATPSTTGTLAYLLVLLGATAWVAWPAIAGVLSVKRRVLLTALVAALSFFAWAKFAGLSEAQAKIDSGEATDIFGTTESVKYQAGLGLIVYCGALVAIWVGVAHGWLAHRAHSAASDIVSFPPPDTSAVSFGR